jgi:hypothetical protein
LLLELLYLKSCFDDYGFYDKNNQIFGTINNIVPIICDLNSINQ